MFTLARVASAVGSLIGSLSFVPAVLADESTLSGGLGGGEGTSSSLPNAGSSEITYVIFFIGAMLFVFGMLKLVSSYRD